MDERNRIWLYWFASLCANHSIFWVWYLNVYRIYEFEDAYWTFTHFFWYLWRRSWHIDGDVSCLRDIYRHFISCLFSIARSRLPWLSKKLVTMLIIVLVMKLNAWLMVAKVSRLEALLTFQIFSCKLFPDVCA